jgi:hypothetical protein
MRDARTKACRSSRIGSVIGVRFYPKPCCGSTVYHKSPNTESHTKIRSARIVEFFQTGGQADMVKPTGEFWKFSYLRRKRMPGTKEISTTVQTIRSVCVCVCVWPRAAVSWPRYQDYTKMHVAAAPADLFPTKTLHFSTETAIVGPWF